MDGHLLRAFLMIWCFCLGQVAAQMDHDSIDWLEEKGERHFEEKAVCELATVTLSDAEKREFLKAHNDVRRRENAANMLKMEWDEDLAKYAQAKANTCGYFHSMDTDYKGLNLGQNLMADWSSVYPSINYTFVTYLWADERDNWDYSANKCQDEQKCGHWKIMTGAASWMLGCGKARCPELNIHGVVQKYCSFVVCNYGPISSKFDRGAPPCSKCYNSTMSMSEKGYTCDDGLCVPCSPKRNSACKCGPAEYQNSCNNGGTYSAEICGCECPHEFYGDSCEKSCQCADETGFPCNKYWASHCADEEHKYWLPEKCQKTCNTCDQFKRPPSCKSG